jgi:hypothetical protein
MMPEKGRPMIDRRAFLRAAGVSLALPWLDARASARPAGPPRRLVCVCAPLGLHAPFFFPEKPGPDYSLSPYLEVVGEFRGDFTVVSGLSHPDVGSGHDSGFSFLTAAPHPELRAGFRNTISLDQFAAERIGGETRFASLSLADEGFGLSWTRSGAPVPADASPSRVFARMFLEGRPEEVRAQARRLRDGQSILDQVLGQVRALGAGLGAADRAKLDEYATGVRELEQRLARAEEWSKKPKPRVDAKQPQDVPHSADLAGKARLMFDLISLALRTDSTRLVTYMMLGTSSVPPIPGVSLGHHDLSHHGQDPNKIEQLRKVELEKMKALRDLLSKLKAAKEEDASLLDRTTIFFSSNLGNASNHSTRNLPVLLAGGGFKHGGHLAFDPAKPPPLSNLFVSMLQRTGVEVDTFGSSTGTLAGLEMAGRP